jgi:hypothetical protein
VRGRAPRVATGSTAPVKILSGHVLSALLAWGAYKLKDEYKEVAVGLGVFAGIVALAAISAWPVAENSCKSLWADGQTAEYIAKNCQVITTCHPGVIGGYCD